MEKKDEVATTILQSIISAIITSAALMVTFLWGLMATVAKSSLNLFYIKWSSVFLVLAILAGLLSLQFSITKARRGKSPPDSKSVAGSFFLSWVFFLIGSGLIAYTVFLQG